MTTTAVPQTITLRGTTYTFTTEDQDLTEWIKILGILRNRRGEFYGFVTQETGSTFRVILSTSRARWTLAEERAALATLTVPGVE